MSAFRIDDGTHQINLGPGMVRYSTVRDHDYTVNADSAIVYGPLLVLRYVEYGKDIRLTIPVNAMVTHVARPR